MIGPLTAGRSLLTSLVTRRPPAGVLCVPLVMRSFPILPADAQEYL